MRVVMISAPEQLLIERRQLGHDRFDEVWEGVVHMVPPPAWEHQELNESIGVFFRTHWQALGLGRTVPDAGVKRPGTGTTDVAGQTVPADFRTPDRSFLLPERYDRRQGGWIVGGPDVVLEIVSPGDESRAKLPFYFSLGVREAILVDRDTRAVEILRAGAQGFESVLPDAQGFLPSTVLGVELRREVGAEGKSLLHLRRSGDPARAMRIAD